MKDTLVFDTKHCTGCRNCVIACSYHHKGIFSPTQSGIEVKNMSQDGGIKILFYVQPCDSHLACNGCHGLEVPFCIKYCPVADRDELKTFLEKYVLLFLYMILLIDFHINTLNNGSKK